MLHLNDRQRSVLIDKLADAANVAAGGLLFGQAIGGQVFSVGFALAGAGAWFMLLALSMFLARKKEY